MVEAPELPQFVVLIEIARDDDGFVAVRLHLEAQHRAGQRLIVEGEPKRRLERSVHHHAEADEAEGGQRLAEGVLDHEGVADLVPRPQERLPRLPVAHVTVCSRRPLALELDERKDLAARSTRARRSAQSAATSPAPARPCRAPKRGAGFPCARALWRKLSRFLAACVLGGLPDRFYLGRRRKHPHAGPASAWDRLLKAMLRKPAAPVKRTSGRRSFPRKANV